MQSETIKKRKLPFSQLNATRVTATISGVIFGFSGMNHGLFEVLQGNRPTDGFLIHAIGEAQRFWEQGTEDAFTIIPNFLISGVLSIVIGLAIIIWSIGFLQTKHGRTVFLLLFILLFLFGGGIGQLAFFIPAWAFATQMDKPLNWWKKVLPRGILPLLSKLWPVTLGLAILAVLFGLEIAIFGIVPGMTDVDAIHNTALLTVLTSAILYIVSYITGFGHELLKKETETIQ